MTRNEALETARANRAARLALPIDDRDTQNAEFGYRHGWYVVGEHSFNNEHLTGEKYDMTQGGWAFI